MMTAPLTRTDIARLWREAYGGQRMDASAEDFARRVERAAIEASGHAGLLAALQNLVAEYEPNIKTFAENAPRKAIWMAALSTISKATGGAS